MQAVILAAGRSTRTHPLTATRPKPLLEVLGKTVLERNLDALRGLVEYVVVVVGYRRDMIESGIGDRVAGMRVVYVAQEEQLGTGHALQTARPHLGERFLVLNGDDLFSRADLEALKRHSFGVLAAEVPDSGRFGAVLADGDRLVRIVEKPDAPVSRLANAGAYAMCSEVFERGLELSPRGELEIVDYVNAAAAVGAVACVRSTGGWLPITYPWSYLEANVALLRARGVSHVDDTAVLEPGTSLQGTVIVGHGSTIRAGTVVEGPVFIGEGCEVGPQAYLRPDTILLAGVRTRGEIVDSVLMRDVTAKHACYIGHSVIGERCNIAAGTITADYRHDGATNWSMINGRKVDSGRRKLGAFVGDGARLGIGTLVYPGRKIWPGRTTMPGEVVRDDIVD